MNFSEPQSKASEEFDYIAGVHICMEVGYIELLAYLTFLRWKKAPYIFTIFHLSSEGHTSTPTDLWRKLLDWYNVMQQKRIKTPSVVLLTYL